MRIVIISDWFSEKMGYAENCLPKALASLGHEVHLVTSDAQVYFNTHMYASTYEPFIGPPIVPCGVKEVDGYTLHRLPHAIWATRLRISGLIKKLAVIKPQIVQTFEMSNISTVEAAIFKPKLGYKLFSEAHVHASIIPPLFSLGGLYTRFILKFVHFPIGLLVSAFIDKCYPISIDAAEIAVRFFGVKKSQIKIVSLGVDTDFFRPPANQVERQMREQMRGKLGFTPNDIVCIYTGRFSPGKNPLCLARAIDLLVKQGKSFKGLFLGSGTKEEVGAIRACAGCIVHSFVPYNDLLPYYWASDIGVWPKQESTSQLDAAACGLPIVLSDRIRVNERVDGNGLLYDEDNFQDLAGKLCCLSDSDTRLIMGRHGTQKVTTDFSWLRIAQDRLKDYEAALRRDEG